MLSLSFGFKPNPFRNMRNDMILPLHQWLKELSVAAPLPYLEEKLTTHPEYPSLASITGLLDDLGLENGAYVVNKADWDELPFPFVAHLNDQQGKLVIVRQRDKSMMDKGGKLEHWHGIAVFAEKPAGWLHQEVNDLLLRQKRRHMYWLLSLSLLAVCCFAVLSPSFSLLSFALLGTTIAGLGIAVLIIQTAAGGGNELTEKLCGVQHDEGCNAVLHSKGSKIGGAFSWSDIGIIYFSASLLLLLNGNPLLPVFSAMAVPFLLFSLYYQWRIIKQWCTLCLLTLAVIGVQFALHWPALTTLSITAVNLSAVAFSGVAFLGSAVVWTGLIRPLIKEKNKIKEDKFRLQRFRYNANIFQTMLHQQKKVNATPWMDDLQTGNPDSPVQIMVACNPYCAPCAKTHQLLHELSGNKQIGVTIRFTSNPSVKDDMRTEAVTYLLRLLSGKSAEFKRAVLHDWYALMNLQQFSLQHPLDSLQEVDDELRQHQQWIDDARVSFTPTLFINGYEMPKEYTAEDLLPVLRVMSGMAAVSEMETT